jgi:hypothetical protein
MKKKISIPVIIMVLLGFTIASALISFEIYSMPNPQIPDYRITLVSCLFENLSVCDPNIYQNIYQINLTVRNTGSKAISVDEAYTNSDCWSELSPASITTPIKPNKLQSILLSPFPFNFSECYYCYCFRVLAFGYRKGSYTLNFTITPSNVTIISKW